MNQGLQILEYKKIQDKDPILCSCFKELIYMDSQVPDKKGRNIKKKKGLSSSWFRKPRNFGHHGLAEFRGKGPGTMTNLMDSRLSLIIEL